MIRTLVTRARPTLVLAQVRGIRQKPLYYNPADVDPEEGLQLLLCKVIITSFYPSFAKLLSQVSTLFRKVINF